MTEKIGKNRDDYKRVNRGLILRLIATGQCNTRVGLVRETGLSKMAISKIIAEMLQRGLLSEVEAAPAGEPGRRPIRLELSPDAPRVLGIAVHRDRCEAVLCALDMTVLRQETLPIGPETDARMLIAMVERLIDTVLAGARNVVSAGVSSIAPIDLRAGRILRPLFFHGIENVPIVQAVRDRCGLPVFFDHDNQSAVMAESLFGNGRGYRDILFAGVGEGVGCGILINGQPYGNRRRMPPELGHVSIDIKGRLCACGNRGCVEAYIRTPVVLRQLQYLTRRQAAYEEFCALRGDEMTDRVFADVVSRLATALVSTLNLFNSELILLGGDAVYWPDERLALLEQMLNERRFALWDQSRVLVRRARFLRQASLIGAACNAVLPIFTGEILFED